VEVNVAAEHRITSGTANYCRALSVLETYFMVADVAATRSEAVMFNVVFARTRLALIVWVMIWKYVSGHRLLDRFSMTSNNLCKSMTYTGTGEGNCARNTL